MTTTDTATIVLKTKTGKTLADFQVPQELLNADMPLVTLVMQSESMNDGERQYWFNLTKVMKSQQVEKLRDILTRERDKLAEIDTKYRKKPKEDPVVAQQRADAAAQKRAEQQKALKEREAAAEAEESQSEEDVLGELENL